MPVVSSASAVVDNNIYVLGMNQSRSFVEIYYPANDTWSIKGITPLGYWSTGAATNGVDALKRIYFFNENRTDIYDPVTDNWTAGATAPTDRLLGIVAVVNETFYLIGGRTGQWGYITMEYPTTLNEQYIPVGYGTLDPSYLMEITPPKISVLSPLNQTYNESSVPLILNADKTVNWTNYSLDGHQNVTFSGNTNLTDISNGVHNITIYAQDTFGNIGSSKTTSFTVAKPEPESFPVVPVIAVVGSCLIGCWFVGLPQKTQRKFSQKFITVLLAEQAVL